MRLRSSPRCRSDALHCSASAGATTPWSPTEFQPISRSSRHLLSRKTLAIATAPASLIELQNRFSLRRVTWPLRPPANETALVAEIVFHVKSSVGIDEFTRSAWASSSTPSFPPPLLQRSSSSTEFSCSASGASWSRRLALSTLTSSATEQYEPIFSSPRSSVASAIRRRGRRGRHICLPTYKVRKRVNPITYWL